MIKMTQKAISVPSPIISTVRPKNARLDPRMIGVASGKGGVGKTWLSIALAQGLSARGRRILLVDLDLGLANIDIQLGIMPQYDLAALIAGRQTLKDVIVSYTLPGSLINTFDILPGRSGAASLAVLDITILDRLLQVIRHLTDYDIILIDLGAGIDPATRFLAASVDTLLVLSTDEPTALADAYAVIKLQTRDRDACKKSLSNAMIDVRLVINQATSLASGQRTYEVLARACGTFLGLIPQLAGVIRRDGRVPESIRRQTTILTRHPNAAASEDVSKIVIGLL